MPQEHMTVTTSRFMEARKPPRRTAKSGRGDTAGEAIPTPEEARARLDAARDRPRPWLTPEAFEAVKGVPEVIGPKTCSKV